MIQVDQKFNIDYVDASGVCKFVRCPAAYMLSRLMGLELPDRMMIAVDYGSAMHRAFPYCYSGPDDISRAVAEFTAAWQAYGYDESDEKRNISRAEASLRNFASVRQPGTSPYTVVKLDVPAQTADIISPNEVPFLVDIGGALPLAGRIDTPVMWQGKLWALDYKTASEISGRYFDNFQFCPQACAYSLALAMTTERDVEGMIIEAVRVCKVTKKGTANDEVQMQPVWIQPHEVESFISLANRKANEIILCNDHQKWPKQCTGCGPYAMFGQPGRVCEFSKICNSPDWRAGARLYSQKEPFHPFKVRKGGDSESSNTVDVAK